MTLCVAGCVSPASPEAVAAESRTDGGGGVPAAVQVTVAAVVVQPSARLVNLVGTLYGNQEVTVSSQVEGQIESLGGDLGDQVVTGQSLAKIDDSQWQTRLREAEAMLAKAKTDEERGRALVAGRVISAQEYESMKTQADVARAQRDTLSLAIRHARVESPLTAAVARRFVSVGEYVRPGTPLFTLVAEDPLKLRGDVPERFANELQVGQTVRVRVEAFPDTTFTGRLDRISPAASPETRSIGIEALVDNHDRRLKPGFFANASIVTRSDDRALMVPQEALITFAGVTKLFVIADGKAVERPVQTGTRGSGGLVEITDGVAAEDSVAVSGLGKLENGTDVSFSSAGAVRSCCVCMSTMEPPTNPYRPVASV